ncbi:MAG: epoxyqueuosine reductase [Clostridia bacterium]|nr:epoxyqueuosine reductase [Clostridia bacterium]
MRDTVAAIFADEGITEYGFLPMDAACVTYPALLSRDGDFTPRSVLLFLVPYYTGPADNLSLYAVSRDYHLYMRTLGERLLSALAATYPDATFRLFSDHSPIDERHAAASCGLGIFGDNGLLINGKYGSLVFVGEVFSSLPPPEGTAVYPLRSCEHCGACRRACPTGALSGAGECLSALTQRKGALAPETVALMRKHRTVWGCDLCQTSCPHTRRAIEAGVTTPISFFHEARLPRLDGEVLASLTPEEFAARAFSWRGRATVERNVRAFEE